MCLLWRECRFTIVDGLRYCIKEADSITFLLQYIFQAGEYVFAGSAGMSVLLLSCFYPLNVSLLSSASLYLDHFLHLLWVQSGEW